MDQKITDLDIAISMSASDLIPIVDANGNNKVLHGSQVKDYVADAVVSDIDDVKAMISDAYDNTATYAVGDYCIYNDTLYRCTTAISTPEDFNPAHWTETSIDAEIAAANSAIVTKANKTDLPDIIILKSTETVNISPTQTTVVSYSFNVPTGYTIIAAYDNSYIGNVSTSLIRINYGSGTKIVHFNYIGLAGQSYTGMTFTCCAVCAKNVTLPT